MTDPNELHVEETPLLPPDETGFNFPFKPYEIQVDFMKSLFEAVENQKLGIFESPTGTGKSLSLLCGALTWLEQREKQHLKDLRTLVAYSNLEHEEKLAKEAENWIAAQYVFRKKKDKVRKATRELEFMEKVLENRSKILQGRSQIINRMKCHPKENSYLKVADNESSDKQKPMIDPVDMIDEFAPDHFSDSDFSDDEYGNDKAPEFHPLKVIFASRTHSQLSQFVKELQKTVFASKITSTCLGSRQNLCINAEVSRLKSLSLMNERCLDLQKASKGKKKENKRQKVCSGCPYFNQKGIEDLKDRILCDPMDIEELVVVAKKSKACPYYASRKASKEAQLILLPYNTILHSSTREGIGIRTENSVVILDEAHNIIDSISNMYSSYVTLPQLQESMKGLKIYMNRYMTRFSAKNLLKIKQISHVLKSFINLIGNSGSVNRVFYVQEYVCAAGVEELDLYELLNYMVKSKLIFKLRGYLQQQENEALTEADNAKMSGSSPKPAKNAVSPGQAVLNFFEFFKSITKSSGSGRIILEGESLKFLLLNTSDHFFDIVNTSRSIILAGGTMKPYEDVEDQLFAGARDRIAHFTCSHVIPDENLICVAVSCGPTTMPFDFTFRNRSSIDMLQELSLGLLNVSRVVPGGLIVFLPSYDFENKFYTHLKNSGILEKIESKKKVFREPNDTNCDKVLGNYAKRIQANLGGAALLAVVGGKLSEGINFANDRGRCVIVVGLPYPNTQSLEIKQKVEFVSEKFGVEKGKQLLTNACFKAVNQSIGRVIRHANDYAAIILLDSRYLSRDSQAQLPGWIRKNSESCNSFGKCMGTLGRFFSAKRSQQNTNN